MLQENILKKAPRLNKNQSHVTEYYYYYSWSSRERPPQKFKELVVTQAGRSQDWALVKWPHSKTIEGGRLWKLQKLINNL